MEIINNKVVRVSTSNELKEILEGDNEYSYIYLDSDITLVSGININNKEKITIDGMYMNNKVTLTGMDSVESSDTICANASNKDICIKNINIVYTNTNGVVYVPLDTKCSETIVTYDNVTFNGTKLSYNPYGTTKIIDSYVVIESINSKTPQEVCSSDHIIIGGNTTISSDSTNTPLFLFRSDTISPSVIFLCKSIVSISTNTKEFMNGTNKLNFTILHDTEVTLVTGNGFAAYTIHGANNVLIDERASLNFIEKSHSRVPMWSVFGDFIVRKGASLSIINSYDNTPTDNYNIHFKGNSQKLIFDNPNFVALYTKNANVLYTNNPLNFSINSTRINMWNDSVILNNAGGIYDLPTYSWYKNKELIQISGTISSTDTTITSHNLEEDELNSLSDLSNFKFQSKKEFSIGTININVHPINNTRNSISGHTNSFASVLIKYKDVSEVVDANSDGFFEYTLSSPLEDGTSVEIVSNVQSTFGYVTRNITTPYDGELSLLDRTTSVVFSLNPISFNPVILPKNKELILKIVDSRVNSSNWKLYAYIKQHLTSLGGYILEDALVFKKMNDEIITLSDEAKIVYESPDNSGDYSLITLTWSIEKGPLLDLSNNTLEANEEYFSDIYFYIEE